MSTQRVTVDPNTMSLADLGRIDPDRVDATTDDDISRQIAADEAEGMQETARFAWRVRKRLGLTQQEFALRIGVSVETIRNWEQGKSSPTGTAQSLLQVLDKAPETSLAALEKPRCISCTGQTPLPRAAADRPCALQAPAAPSSLCAFLPKANCPSLSRVSGTESISNRDRVTGTGGKC